MSRWQEDLKNHAFQADWTQLEATIANGAIPEGADLATTQEIARLRKVMIYIQGALVKADPELIPPSLLSSLHSQVQSALNEVRTYFSNYNVGHLRNANAHADGMLSVVAQNLFLPSGQTGPVEAAATYQQTLEEYAKSYDRHIQALLSSATGRVDSLNSKAESTNEAMTKLDARITAMEAQLPTQLSGYNTAFQASEAQRAERFDSWTQAYQQKLDEQFATAAAKHAKGLDVLGDYQERAGKVLGSVVDTAQAGAYATYASEEKTSANAYRRYAITLMAAAALVLFMPEIAHFVREASGYTVDWQKALYRLPFSLILFAPALYLAKESSKHRTNEVANRRRQHILTTIGPYLALLDAKRAEEIKAEVAKSIFADNLPILDDKSSDAGNVIAQISALVSTVVKAKSRG